MAGAAQGTAGLRTTGRTDDERPDGPLANFETASVVRHRGARVRNWALTWPLVYAGTRVNLKPRRERNRGARAGIWALTWPLLYLVTHVDLKTRAGRNGPNEPATHYGGARNLAPVWGPVPLIIRPVRRNDSARAMAQGTPRGLRGRMARERKQTQGTAEPLPNPRWTSTPQHDCTPPSPSPSTPSPSPSPSSSPPSSSLEI